MNPLAQEHREIERRFLVEQPPDLSTLEHHEVSQGYLTSMPTIVRIRNIGDTQFFLTVKRGAQANHEEREINLSKEQFEALWPVTTGRRICKTRYLIPHGNLLIELDVFQGSHTGLRIAEIEFPGIAEAKAFVPLPWFGREVTEDIAYANVSLATE
ncbi:MAG: CYTH domain-containing protein [Chthoniobacterales bacterium]